jgi:hypothetical protein
LADRQDGIVRLVVLESLREIRVRGKPLAVPS